MDERVETQHCKCHRRELWHFSQIFHPEQPRHSGHEVPRVLIVKRAVAIEVLEKLLHELEHIGLWVELRGDVCNNQSSLSFAV